MLITTMNNMKGYSFLCCVLKYKYSAHQNNINGKSILYYTMTHWCFVVKNLMCIYFAEYNKRAMHIQKH